MRITILLSSLCMFLNSTTKLHNAIPIPDKVIVEFVSFEIDTPFSIDCENFESFFQEDVKSVLITDSLVLKEITCILNNLPPDTLNLYPDTRLKIKIDTEEEIQEICVGNFSVSKNNELYLYTNDLKKLLNKYINDL